MDEIIIDGFDVAGCEYRSDIHRTLLADGAIKEFSNYCYISNDGCYNINCYYKQLKRTQNALQGIKTLVTIDYIQIKKQLVQNYDCLDNFMQKIEDKCNEVIV